MCDSCGKPTGAGWWRVSTDGRQKELSPDTQQKESLALAEKDGVHIVYMLGTDWASLEVWDSPTMQQLKDLIKNRAKRGTE